MRNRNCQENCALYNKREGRAAVKEYIIYLLQLCSQRPENALMVYTGCSGGGAEQILLGKNLTGWMKALPLPKLEKPKSSSSSP